ncbi:hypothetical protein [Actinoallomurus acanthiterrae]
MTTSTAEVVQHLQEVLGPDLTAFIAGVGRRTVSRWAGGRDPSRERQACLRAAYQIVRLLEREHDAEAVRSWFAEVNPERDGRRPAAALSQGWFTRVLAAARAFAETR